MTDAIVFITLCFFTGLLLLWFNHAVQVFVFGRELFPFSSPSDRNQLLVLSGVLTLGLALRLVAAWMWNTHQPSRLTADEPGYASLATELLQGRGFVWPGRVPLYPAWLAAVFLASGSSYTAVRWLQVLWSVLTLLLVFALGRRMFGAPAGLLAAALAAISIVLIYQPVRLLSEVLYTPFVLLAAIALWDALHKPSLWKFALAGGLIGATNLIRPTMFLFPVFLALLLVVIYGIRRAWRPAGMLLLASSLIIAPWMLHNYLRYQAVYPLATSNAFLWQGSPEYYHLVRDEGYTYLDVWEKVIYGPDSKLHDPGSVEGDRWWTQRALRSIRAEPGVYARYFVEKLATYWIGDPNADWADTYVFNFQALLSFGFPKYIAVQYMAARFLPVIALLAAIWLALTGRTPGEGGLMRVNLLPVFAILVYNTLLHAATHAEARLSEPLQPFLFILIAGAAYLAWSRR